MSRPPAHARPLERGSPETKPRSCGNQPAHESLLNRRLEGPVCRQAHHHLYLVQRMLETHYPAQRLDREHESRSLKNSFALAL
jgi:hypothetical protein